MGPGALRPVLLALADERDTMATKPAVQCPLCQSELDESTDLEDHLVEDHTPRELASAVATRWEGEELGSESD